MAAYIPDEKISAIKNASDIVEIVSESVSLRRAGRNFLGLCPFHTEKTPSFTVSPDKQIFYCFGCGAGGNVFSFLMKQAGMTFPEAARTLAQRYGIDLPSQNLSPYEKKKLTEREMILTLNAAAMTLYRDCLRHEKHGRQALGYLMKRGMTRKTIDDFNLGLAPERWDFLLRSCRSHRKPVDGLLKAGLVIARRSGDGHYDRFRNRIIFPIADAQNQVVGFGGRVMDDALPKYLNSPETPVYNKSRSLYGLHRARPRCRETQTVYVVEGYFDLLTMHQFGLSNTVATLGTSLTADHVQMLKGYVGERGTAILVYDSDQAGIKAAQRSVAVFQKGLLDARILVLPQGHDPDSFLMEQGPDDFMQAAGQAMDMITFMIETAIQKYGLSIDGKVHVVDDLKPALLAIGDPVARSLQVKHLAERIAVDEAVILQKIQQPTNARSRGAVAALQPRAAASPTAAGLRSDTYRLEQQVVAMMLQCPELTSETKKRQLLAHIADPLLERIAQGIADHFAEGGGDVASLLARWEDPEQKAMVARLAIIEEPWDRDGCRRLINQFEASVRRRDNALLKRIAAAEKKGDMDLLAELLEEKQQQVRNRLTNRGGTVR